jgi:hypothetical protein
MASRLASSRFLVALAVLLSGLVVSPGQALTLITSGTGLVPCAEGQCLDFSWRWHGSTADPAGETTLVLPVPDSRDWFLSGGSISTFGDTVAFSGTFDRRALVGHPPGASHGNSTASLRTTGADGALLTEHSIGLSAFCPPGDTSPVICGDANAAGIARYSPIPGDRSLLAPLTLSYDFAPVWRTQPLSQEFLIDFGGRAQLVYAPIPEPGAALIMAVGLFAIAAASRRHRA